MNLPKYLMPRLSNILEEIKYVNETQKLENKLCKSIA